MFSAPSRSVGWRSWRSASSSPRVTSMRARSGRYCPAFWWGVTHCSVTPRAARASSMATAVAGSGAPSSRPYRTWLWRSTKPIGAPDVSQGAPAHNIALPWEIQRDKDPRAMAQPEKRENSVLFSLRDLRQIEENRVQEEEQAVRSAEEQKIRAKENAERAAREAEEDRKS